MMSNIDKNETSRFLGEGVSFKAKLIGILEVSEARGDRMCQDALSDLKIAIRAAGEHKQRIIINIAIDGLRLRDEKTGDSLYHHPVHKISFIAQDMTDSRAFGYIFGSPETGHRFFGIKTDKAASQVVIAMRDLFQVVFALKKKEIELAKQHLDKGRFSSSPLFSDSSLPISKIQSGAEQTTTKSSTEHKPLAASSSNKSGGETVADLVDLELELNNLQQGLNQMERITPSDPFGSKEDPFGDSFIMYPQKPILPPPPSGRDRSNRSSESKTPASAASTDQSSDLFKDKNTSKIFSFSHEFSTSFEDHSSGDWFASTASTEEKQENNEASCRSDAQFDVFTELDPLGTGKIKPYVDKKHFFQELKNPPKKVLKDLVTNQNQTQPEPNLFNLEAAKPLFSGFGSDPFEDDPFKEDPFAETDFSKHDPFDTDYTDIKLSKLNNSSVFLSKSPKSVAFENRSLELSSESEGAPEPPPRPPSEIKPPPLPPKKQAGDFLVKPPPRPPHIEDANFQEGNVSNIDLQASDSTPPIPAPFRKPKYETRSKTQYGDDDYLTPISLPPPAQHVKRHNATNVTVASYLESRPNATFSTASEGPDSLDITLSQLTLSGLNQLAGRLNIAPEQLSNMTLAQLTSYLKNFMSSSNVVEEKSTSKMPTFKVDFDANFANSGSKTDNNTSYDRYAVFRELINEEVKPALQETQKEEEETYKNPSKVINNISEEKEDKYAALREIVEMEINQTENENTNRVSPNFDTVKQDELEKNKKNELKDEKIINKENELKKDADIIEYSDPLAVKSENKDNLSAKSPISKKSPMPVPVSEIIQKNVHLTSGSLSDVISGSSPEVDNTGSTSEIVKKGPDIAGESWAIFDKPNNNNREEQKTKHVIQNEEGAVSPWSSDSKEFVNGSPPEWRQRVDSSSGGDHCIRRRKSREQDDWWDTSAEPEAVQYYSSNRRSTDSYEDECYECYDRPRRRRQTASAAGGHSSSSRDVSPWEEEPRRREPKPNWSRHSRMHKDKRHTDSWDEEDDYEYEEEHSGRFHWPERHGKRESDRERHSGSSREHEECWLDDWEEERKYRKRRDADRDRWCCPDWEQTMPMEKTSGRYMSGRFSNPDQMLNKWHDKKHDDHYYGRDSQQWDDNNEDARPHYATAKRNWKRPSSASEMDRKMGDLKSRQIYCVTGGSDGERERRFKGNRRSKSRDSQYSESSYNRHKPDPGLTLRNPHRSKQHQHVEPEPIWNKNIETYKKNCRKPKEMPKNEPKFDSAEFPQKKTEKEKDRFTFDHYSKKSSLFEDDFSPTESGICSIQEEPSEEVTAKIHKGKRKFFRNKQSCDLKKSESVNIFSRENDPFDDDFFSENAASQYDSDKVSSPRNTDLKWSENFDVNGKY